MPQRTQSQHNGGYQRYEGFPEMRQDQKDLIMEKELKKKSTPTIKKIQDKYKQNHRLQVLIRKILNERKK